MNRFTKTFVAAAVALLVFGCSGTPNSSQTGSSSSSSSSTTGSYTIGGTVTGLTGSGLVLQDNSGDNLTITASGAFTFKTSIVSGKTYSVSVFAQPTSPAQTCVVTAGSGTTTANVTTVQVACGTNTVSIGLTVTGLLAPASYCRTTAATISLSIRMASTPLLRPFPRVLRIR